MRYEKGQIIKLDILDRHAKIDLCLHCYLITSLLLSLSRVWRKKYPVRAVPESSTFLFRLNRDRNTAFRLPNALVSHAKWPRLLEQKDGRAGMKLGGPASVSAGQFISNAC